jgi:hypothetical protein
MRENASLRKLAACNINGRLAELLLIVDPGSDVLAALPGRAPAAPSRPGSRTNWPPMQDFLMQGGHS